MDRSSPHPSGSQGTPSESPSRRDTTDPGPIPGTAEEGRRGSSQVSPWNGKRIGLLMLGVIVLTWFPMLGPLRDATSIKRARGRTPG